MTHRLSVQGLVLLLALLAPTMSDAQSLRGGVRLGAGLVRHGQTDLMASPLRYRGVAPQAVAGYTRVGSATRFDVAASFSAVSLESRISDGGHRQSAVLAAVRVLWLRRVTGPGRWQGFLGGRVDAMFSLRWHEYVPDRTELFGDIFVPLQATAAHELRLSHDLVLWQRLAVPVAAVVLRSPYTGLKYFPDVELAPPGRLLGLDHALGADWALTARWSVRAEWATALLRYPDPRELSMVTHRVEVGLEVRR